MGKKTRRRAHVAFRINLGSSRLSSHSPYEIEAFSSAKQFLSACEEWLIKVESDSNALLAIAHCIADERPGYPGTNEFYVVREGPDLVGTFLVTEAEGLFTTDIRESAVPLLVSAITKSQVDVRKINGPAEISMAIANALTHNNLDAWEVSHDWQGMVTASVTFPSDPPAGSLRLASDADRELINEWGTAYGIEKPAPIDVPTFLFSKMATDDLYLWEDVVPRTVIAVSGATMHCARVSAVFTPKEHRSMGYAKIAVATTTDMLLSSGIPKCSLVVDVEDQYVVELYRRIGYSLTDRRCNITLK